MARPTTIPNESRGSGSGRVTVFWKQLLGLALNAVLLLTAALLVWYLVSGASGYRVGEGILFFLALAGGVWLATTRPVRFVLVAWVIFVMQQPLGAYVGSSSAEGARFVGRIDDATILILVVGLFIRRTLGLTVHRGVAAAVIPYTGVLLSVGVVSAMLRADVGFWTLAGAWLSLKVWVVVATLTALPWTERDFDRITRWILVTASVVTVFAAIDYASAATLQALLHTPPENVDPLEPARSHYVQSVFASASRYSNFMTIAFSVALARYATDRRMAYLVGALVFGVAGLASLRLRGLLAAVAVVLVLVLVVKGARMSRALQFAAATVACILVVGPSAFEAQLGRFTSQPNSTARGVLYANAFKLADDYFPLGVGFGRYGSYASIIYYSPLYYALGMSSQFGLSQTDPNFITDTSWAGYIAELGLLGAALMVIGLGYLGWKLTVMARSNDERAPPATVALAVLVATVTMSIGSAALLDSVVLIAFGMFAGCAFRQTCSHPSNVVNGR
jgi:hypothetical protein